MGQRFSTSTTTEKQTKSEPLKQKKPTFERLAHLPTHMRYNSGSYLFDIDTDFFALNHNELVMVGPKALFKYNIKVNKWYEWIKYSIDIGYGFTSTYNKKLNSIYIHKEDCDILKINLTTEQCKLFKVKGNDYKTKKYEAASVFVNDELHIVGGIHMISPDEFTGHGGHPIDHVIWNENDNCYKKVYCFETEFNDQGILYGHRMVYIKQQNIILLIGGCSMWLHAYWFKGYNSIYSFNLQTKKWSQLSLTLSDEMYGFGCIVLQNTQEMLIFGGVTPNTNEYRYIDVIDLKNMEIKLSKLIIPSVGGNLIRARGVLMDDNVDNLSTELLLYGLMRNNFENSKHKDINIPSDIVIVIKMYNDTQTIHIFEYGQNHHFRVKVEDILKGYQER